MLTHLESREAVALNTTSTAPERWIRQVFKPNQVTPTPDSLPISFPTTSHLHQDIGEVTRFKDEKRDKDGDEKSLHYLEIYSASGDEDEVVDEKNDNDEDGRFLRHVQTNSTLGDEDAGGERFLQPPKSTVLPGDDKRDEFADENLFNHSISTSVLGDDDGGIGAKLFPQNPQTTYALGDGKGEELGDEKESLSHSQTPKIVSTHFGNERIYERIQHHHAITPFLGDERKDALGNKRLSKHHLVWGDERISKHPSVWGDERVDVLRAEILSQHLTTTPVLRGEFGNKPLPQHRDFRFVTVSGKKRRGRMPEAVESWTISERKGNNEDKRRGMTLAALAKREMSEQREDTGDESLGKVLGEVEIWKMNETSGDREDGGRDRMTEIVEKKEMSETSGNKDESRKRILDPYETRKTIENRWDKNDESLGRMLDAGETLRMDEEKGAKEDESLGRMLEAVVRREMSGCTLLIAFDSAYYNSSVLTPLMALPNPRQVSYEYN